MRLLIIQALIVLVPVGCSGAGESKSPRRGTSNQSPEGGQSPDNSGASLSCEAQWTLAVKQQPTGASFNYSGKISVPSFGMGGALSYTRLERIVASSDESITRSFTVTSSVPLPQISDALAKLNTAQLTLTKDKFIETCNKAGGEPVTSAGLGGTVTVSALRDEVITMTNGKTFQTKRGEINVSNVSLGDFQNVNATVVTNISKSYPMLPLKQMVTLNQISVEILRGAVLNEELVSQP